jgi:hypothetical protein
MTAGTRAALGDLDDGLRAVDGMGPAGRASVDLRSSAGSSGCTDGRSSVRRLSRAR